MSYKELQPHSSFEESDPQLYGDILQRLTEDGELVESIQLSSFEKKKRELKFTERLETLFQSGDELTLSFLNHLRKESQAYLDLNKKLEKSKEFRDGHHRFVYYVYLDLFPVSALVLSVIYSIQTEGRDNRILEMLPLTFMMAYVAELLYQSVGRMDNKRRSRITKSQERLETQSFKLNEYLKYYSLDQTEEINNGYSTLWTAKQVVAFLKQKNAEEYTRESKEREKERVKLIQEEVYSKATGGKDNSELDNKVLTTKIFT